MTPFRTPFNMFGTSPGFPRFHVPIPEGENQLDWSQRLGIEAIRRHTKTDDIPGTTDDQLEFLREAAIEAAELYTGMLLAKTRSITEPIQGPSKPKFGKYTYKYRLQYPVADGWVHLYGGTHPNDNGAFPVKPGSRVVEVPIRTGYPDLSNCCDPCSVHHMNRGMMAAYNAGFASADAVPSGIVLGCLQFITWALEHPGDELLTNRNLQSSQAGAISGSNNVALVSGALEIWRTYDPEAT